ncbi:MAG: hypothetical protein QG668_630, partial [Patescibacteria group bacterium]|nr:hypothetical protein [Patescibacteria group bacterium]
MCVSQASHAMARRFHHGQERPSCPARPAAWERPRLVFHDPEVFGAGANTPHVEALHRAAALAALPKGPSGGLQRGSIGERVLVNKSGGTRWCAMPPAHVPAKARLKGAGRWTPRG